MLLLKANGTKRHKPQISHRQNRWHYVLLLCFFRSIFFYVRVTAKKKLHGRSTAVYEYILYIFSPFATFSSFRCDAAWSIDRCQFLFRFLFYFVNCMPLSYFFLFYTPASLAFLVLMLLSPLSRLISFYCCCRYFFSLYLSLSLCTSAFYFVTP